MQVAKLVPSAIPAGGEGIWGRGLGRAGMASGGELMSVGCVSAPSL